MCGPRPAAYWPKVRQVVLDIVEAAPVVPRVFAGQCRAVARRRPGLRAYLSRPWVDARHTGGSVPRQWFRQTTVWRRGWWVRCCTVLFTGLWPPTLWLIGASLCRYE